MFVRAFLFIFQAVSVSFFMLFRFIIDEQWRDSRHLNTFYIVIVHYIYQHMSLLALPMCTALYTTLCHVLLL